MAVTIPPKAADITINISKETVTSGKQKAAVAQQASQTIEQSTKKQHATQSYEVNITQRHNNEVIANQKKSEVITTSDQAQSRLDSIKASLKKSPEAVQVAQKPVQKTVIDLLA